MTWQPPLSNSFTWQALPFNFFTHQAQICPLICGLQGADRVHLRHHHAGAGAAHGEGASWGARGRGASEIPQREPCDSVGCVALACRPRSCPPRLEATDSLGKGIITRTRAHDQTRCFLVRTPFTESLESTVLVIISCFYWAAASLADVAVAADQHTFPADHDVRRAHDAVGQRVPVFCCGCVVERSRKRAAGDLELEGIMPPFSTIQILGSWIDRTAKGRKCGSPNRARRLQP